MVATASAVGNDVVETELYRCVLDREEKTISITTSHGAEAARRFAEFEADRLQVSISLIFGVGNSPRTYIFRLRGGCMEDSDDIDLPRHSGSEVEVDAKPKTNRCPHGNAPHSCATCRERMDAIVKAKPVCTHGNTSSDDCALCERLVLIAKIKRGEL